MSTFRNECALIPMLDLEDTMKVAVGSQLHASSSGQLIKLPCPFPRKGEAGFEWLTGQCRQKKKHSKPVIMARERDQSGTDRIEIVSQPRRCVGDTPPTPIFNGDVF